VSTTGVSIAGKTVLITGASNGIGLELARIFAQNRCHLVILSRNRHALKDIGDELQRLYGVTVFVLPKDLAHPKAPTEAFADLQEAGVKIDYLVNNAGFGGLGPVWQRSLEDDLDMIQVNVTALTHLTKLFLPQIMERRGKVMNVASTAAFQPGPLMAVYYASKAYVLSFSEALAEELRGTGVTVTTLCPGPVPTGFQERAGGTHNFGSRGPMVLSASEVARIGFDAFLQGKRVVIPGKLNWLGAQGTRLAPRTLTTRLIKKMQQGRKK
jgi:short-subunit dehydrogenase